MAYKWTTAGPILKCPYCKHYLVHEQRGPCKLRGPTKDEIAEAFRDSPKPQDILSYARTREDESEPPPSAKEDSDG